MRSDWEKRMKRESEVCEGRGDREMRVGEKKEG